MTETLKQVYEDLRNLISVDAIDFFSAINEEISTNGFSDFIPVKWVAIDEVEHPEVKEILTGNSENISKIYCFDDSTNWPIMLESFVISEPFFYISLDKDFVNNKVYNLFWGGKISFSNFITVEEFSGYNKNDEINIQLKSNLNRQLNLKKNQIEEIIGNDFFSESCPSYLNLEDDIVIEEMNFQFSLTDQEMTYVTISTKFGIWNVLNATPFSMKNSILEYHIQLPYEENSISYIMEGTLKLNNIELPSVKIFLPPDNSDDLIKITMLNESYAIANLSQVKDIFGGIDLLELLPFSIGNFTGPELRYFYSEVDKDFTGLYNISLGCSLSNDSDFKWEIIPDVLSMKSVSLEFSYYPLLITIRGTVVLNSLELPMKFTYAEAESSQTKRIILELDIQNNEDFLDIPVNVTDFSGLGINFPDKIRGLTNIEILLSKLEIEFSIEDSILVERCLLEIGSGNSWNILSHVNIGNFVVTCEYENTPEDSGSSFSVFVFGVMSLDTEGSVPIPIRISMMDEEWFFELGDRDIGYGLAIPGIQGLTDFAGVDLSAKLPDDISFDNIHLTDFYISSLSASEGMISIIYFEIKVPGKWSFGLLEFFDMSFKMEIDFSNNQNIITFVIQGNIEINGVVINATVQKTTDEWIFTIEETDISLSLDSLKDLIPLASGISTPAFINNILDVSINIQKLQMIYNSAMDNLKEFSYDITLNKPWIIAENIIELKELGMEYRCWNLDQSESSSEGSLYSNLMFGSLEVPTVIPLPFNSGEWTIQLGGDITIPQLSYFTNFIGFDIDNLLKELPGIDETPETRISRFDIKFDTDPYKTEKFAFAFSFNEGYSITLPPGIEVRLDSIELEYINETSDSEITFVITGAIIEKIGKETTLPVTLSRTSSHWQLSMNMGEEESINIDLGLISSILPGINLPSKVAESGLDIYEINLKLTHSMELEEFFLIFDLNGANNLIPVDLIKERISVKAIYEIEGGQSRFGIQLLEWPFTMGSMTYIEDPAYEGWVLIDLGEFGALKMELPKFVTEGDNFIINGEIISTNNGEEITIRKGNKTEIFSGKELNIPIKFILDKMGLSFLNLLLPDSIPLTPEKDLRGIIRQAKGDPDNLPYSFQDYLDIEVPDGIQYDLVISGGGSLSIILSLPDSVEDEDKPLKILIPAGLNLLGMKIYNIGFSTIGGFPFLNLDIEFDSFLLPI